MKCAACGAELQPPNIKYYHFSCYNIKAGPFCYIDCKEKLGSKSYVGRLTVIMKQLKLQS